MKGMKGQIQEFWSNIENVERATAEDIQSDVLAYLAKIKELRGSLEEAVKALEWYEDVENYKGVFQPTGFQVYIKPVEADKGELARTTLKRIKGENG